MKCNWYCRVFPTCNLVFIKHQHFSNSSKDFLRSSEFQLYTLSKEPCRTHPQSWVGERKLCTLGKKIWPLSLLSHPCLNHLSVLCLFKQLPMNRSWEATGKWRRQVRDLWEKFYKSSGCRSDNTNHKTQGRGKEKVVYESQAKIFSPRSGNSLIHLVVNLEWIICSSNGEGRVHTVLALAHETVWFL